MTSKYDTTRTATIQYHSASGKFEVIVRAPCCEPPKAGTQVDRQTVGSAQAATEVIRRWDVDPTRVTVVAAD